MSFLIDEMKEIQLRSDIPLFLYNHRLNKRICEVGTRFGFNLQQLLAADPELLVAVDHYQNTGKKSEQDTNLDQKRLNDIYGDVFVRFLKEPAVKIFRGKSEDAAKLFPLRFFDFVYVDADHSRQGALNDIRLWWPRVRQGGILAGHDYIETKSQNGVEFGVVEAVKEFIKETKIEENCFHHTNEGFCSWMIFKKDGE